MSATHRSYLLAALACAASAGYIAWQGAIDSPLLRVPPIIAYLAAFVFALTAMRLMQLRANADSPGDAFALLFFGAIAAIGGWIAIGAGPRICVGSIGDGAATSASGLWCRVPFGIGALITAGCAFYVAVRIIKAQVKGFRSPG